jgi:hypothetical protein
MESDLRCNGRRKMKKRDRNKEKQEKKYSSVILITRNKYMERLLSKKKIENILNLITPLFIDEPSAGS